MDVPVRLLTVTGFLLIAGILGCQTPNPSIELLESELRWMEDQLYALDQQLDQANLQLASCQRNNVSLRQELAMAYQGSGHSPQIQIESDTNRTPPSSSPPTTQAAPAHVDRVPAGIESARPSSSGQRDSFWDSEQDSLPAPEVVIPREASHGSQPVDVHVARVVLNSRLTGGYDFDGKPGDEGLLVVVEPQNSAGQYVALPGDLIVEVFNPAVTGPAGRLARWQFDASETVPHLRQTLLGRGVHLQLPWPVHPPNSSNLVVVASYRTPTGAQLAAKREIRVDLVPNQPTYDVAQRAGLPDRFIPTGITDPSILLDQASLTVPNAPGQILEHASTTAPTQTAAPATSANQPFIPATATRPLGPNRSLVPTWSPRRY